MIVFSDLPYLAVGGVVAYLIKEGVKTALRPRPAPSREVCLPGDVVLVALHVRIPKAAARQDVSDWLNLMVAGIGSMRSDNALHDCEVEAHALAWEDAEPASAEHETPARVSNIFVRTP